MSDVRLYLNGQLVDIDPKTSIVETKQINNLFELQDRQTSYTKNFNVLLTKKTLKVLDNVGKPYNRSIKPYRYLKAQVYRGSSATIVDGYFHIKEVITKKQNEDAILRGNIFSGNFGLFDVMGKKLVSELGVSSLNHQFTEQNIISSWSNNWQDGYTYPVANYGYFKPTESTTTWLIPCIYLKWIWERIFTQNGFTYEYVGSNNPFESNHFKTKVISVEKSPIDLKEETINYSPVVKFEELLSISQKDFFKQIIQMYGLMFQRDKIKKHYKFITVKDLFSRRDDAQDLSNKLFRRTKTAYNFGTYAQKNDFSYHYDNKDEAFFDDSFFIDDKTLPKEKKVVTSYFKAPLKSDLIYDNRELFDFNFFEPEYNDDGTLKKVKGKKSKSYILNVSKDNKAYADFNDLDWDYLLRWNYLELSIVFSRQNIIDVELELTSKDIRNFDFFKLVYLRQYQAYYYCNKISNYKENKVTKVQLVRVSTIGKLSGEYNQDYSNDYNNINQN